MHAHQMTDEQIIDAIDNDPRLAHITAAARRTTVVEVPTEDPRSHKRAVEHHEERQAFLATLPRKPGLFSDVLKALDNDAA